MSSSPTLPADLSTLSVDEIERLWNLLEDADAADDAADTDSDSIPRRDPGQPIPLSFAQQRLWLLAQLDPGSASAYLIPAGVRLRGALQVTALQRTLERIVARHEALRTRIVTVNGAAEQRIDPAGSGFALTHIDLSQRGLEEAQAEAHRQAMQEATTPFDLAQGPLIRGRLLCLAAHDHVLLLTMHHIVSDGWSMGLLIRELGTLYTALAQGLDDPLPALSLQYADIVAWQRRQADGPALQRQLDFWRAHLRNAPTVLDLPCESPRPAVQDHAGDRVEIVLDADLSSALAALSKRHGVTLFVTMMASWGVLLSRQSGQDSVVIGSPVANRHRAEFEPVIGFFANTQALHVDLSGNPTVAALLAQVRTLAAAAQAHQDLPFEQLVEALNPVRDLSRHPLFQVLLSWQDGAPEMLALPGLELERFSADHRSAKFDLELSLQNTGTRIVGQLTFATALFERSTIERHLAQFVTLLRGMVADDRACVAHLPLLADDEHAQLRGFNATATDLGGTGYLHRAIEAQAQRTPDAIAVTDDHGTLSYADLDARANRLAHHLIGLGVVPESSVAVCLPRSIDLVIALLAILKAGAAYLPLDADVPPARLDGMLADARPRVLLAHRHTAALLTPRDDRHTVLLDADAALWACASTQAPTVALLPQHPAYVIYTSGSTGTPKGVVNTHAAIDNRLLWMQQALQLQPEQRVLQKTPVGFDVSVWELFWPLRVGARLVLAEPGGHKDPAYLIDLIEQAGIDTVHFVPSMLRVFLDVLPQGACASLRRIVCSGEALAADLAQAARARLPQARLYNLYGPTEAAVDVSAWECTDADANGVPIGRPIANTQLHVLDTHGQLAPIGVAGELQIAGVQLARGYLGRPDLTAERFVPDPFAEQPGERMYKTGDLARWQADGSLAYLGRNDEQVKIRGFRIELGEIVAALRGCDGVRQAAVIASEDSTGDKRLIAYVVGDADVALDPDALRTRLGARLPDYMLPAAYVQLPALPLTANGKLDRRALPAPDADALATQAYVAPEGELEMMLAAVWSELLGVERVGRHDSFFALGGHSLLAITLIERLRQHGWQLDVRALFTHATLAAVAETLRPEKTAAIPQNRIAPDCSRITPALLPLVQLTQVEIDAIVCTVDGGTANIQDIYPLAPLQEGLLFHHLADPGADPYVNTTLLAFETQQQAAAFLSAFDQVVQRHDILRTSIVWQDLPAPMQVVWRHAALQVHRYTLQGQDAQAELLTRMGPDHARLDLAKAPLLQAHLGEDMAQQRWIVGVLAHHLVMDHTTLDLIIAEIGAHLSGRQQQLPAPLPFRNFVAQAQRAISTEHVPFFSRMLRDVDHPTTPFGLLRNDINSAPAQQRVPVARDIAHSLRAHARRLGVNASSLFHLAYAVLLARISARNDVVFGTVLFGRLSGSDGADRALGMFLNTLPLRVRIDATSVTDAVRRMQEQMAELLCHEHVALTDVRNCSAIRAPLPLFSALLNYRYAGHTPSAAEHVAHDEAWQGVRVLQARERTTYPLSLSVNDDGDGFSLDLQIDPCLCAERVAGFMLHALQQLNLALSRAPDTPLCALQILPAGERAWLLHDVNATPTAPRAAGDTLLTRFQAQVRQFPTAPALIDGDLVVSYAELQERAAVLAQRLLASGVTPGGCVALLLPRSALLIVAELAVLMCGAAYVALDPAQPPARLHALLEDCAAAALLCDADCPLDAVGLPRLQVEWAVLTGEAVVPHVQVTSASIAYVVYTSGSSGTPKGVAVSHAAVLAFALNPQHAPLQSQDRVAFLANPAFDASTFEVWATLLHGAAIVVVDQPTLLDPSALAQHLTVNQVSILHLTAGLLPGYWHALRDLLPRLRCLLTGGDSVDAGTVAAILAHAPPQRLLHCYGPTEATTFSVVHPVAPLADDAARIPLGRPLPGSRVYVLDRHGQPTPIGVAGELHLAGAQLAQGYLHRPDLTAERFVPDPFAEQAGERMYKTGDLACWRDDGTLDFLGRNDAQVTIRGFRIEPGEIQAALRSCAGVQEAVVIARDDTGEKRLVAYLVGDASILEPATLRSQLATRLPDHMLPAAYVQLDALPLTPNGKLDRAALPVPDDQALDLHAYVAPQGELEQVLVTLWSELLGVEQVGRNDDFFALGGHSLLAIKLIERLRRLGWQIDVRALFAQPTPAGLAVNLQTASAIEVPPNRIGPECTCITPDLLPLVALTQAEIDAIVATVDGGVVNVQDIYPLAPLQEGLLFHHLADPLADPYLHSSVLGFPAKEQLDRFLDALDQVIARHDILRTGVVWQGLSAPVQVVWRQAVVPRRMHCFEGPDPATGLLAWLHAPEAAPSLQHAPLIHAHLAHDTTTGRWLLGLQQHHLVMDHTTLELVIEEVRAHLDGRHQQLPTPLPFRNFVAHAHAGVSEQEHKAFFTTMLADIDAPTAPFGVLAPVRDPAALHFLRLSVPATLATAVRTQARQHGISAATLFHLAYALLLARTSGTTEAVFATLLFGRMHASAGVDRVLGMFLNTLPIRLDASHGSVLDAVRQTQLCLAQLLHHEHAPLALAQRCSTLDPSTPLLNALLNYRYVGGSAVLGVEPEGEDLAALDGVQEIAGQERTHYPLLVSVNDQQPSGGFSLDVQCVQKIGTERIAAMLLQTLQVLIQALEHAPQTALHALDLLPENERQALHHFNDTTAELDGSGYLHRAIQAQARRTPQAVALVEGEVELSYAALDARANQLAHHLIALGVVPEDRVAVCLPRSLDLVVALLAVLKAGAAYLPLETDVPPARLDGMLADAQPAVLLAYRETAARLERREQQNTVLLDTDQAAWKKAPTHAPVVPALHPQHPAYVLYTSGSTGQPKGVVNTHAGIDNRLQWMQQALQLHSSQRVLQKTPVGFDVSVWELFWPLRVGACLVLAEPGGHKDPAYLIALIEQTGIDTVHFVPSMLRVFLDALPQGACASLQRIVCSGEALPADLAADALARLPQTRLYNLYGPTEAAVDVSVWECSDADVTNVPIGRPIANTRLHVLDAHRALAPVGVTGELQIAGVQLARGYLGRPDLTAERFVPDPFAEQPGQRMYRTGDLARWRVDGALEYLGRNDEQIKLRGVRIELGEIAAALRACNGVREAVVIARENAGEKRLIAYLVGDATPLDGTDVPTADALRTQLAACLPEVMLPSAYVWLDTLPLTTNGKLDRRALPAADADALAAQAYVAPEGEMETQVAALWSELLGIEGVGRHDSFFALGGHSLLAMRLISRLRGTLGRELPLATLFAQPRLADLAHVLEGAAAIALPAIVPADRRQPLPLSFAQKRLWFLAQLDTRANLASHIPIGLRLHGALAADVLQRALDRIVARHEALRTRFVAVDGGARQEIAPADSGFALRRFDLSQHPDADTEIRAHAQHEANEVFDLSNGPLARGRLLRLGNDTHVLFLTLHHLVADGWSIGVLVREFVALYTAMIDGQPDPLPPLPLQYADVAVWQQHTLGEHALQRQRRFWQDHLAGAPELLELPTDRPRPALQDYRGDALTFQVDQPTSIALKALSERHGATLYMTLLAGWAILLARLSGQQEVVIGSPVANRNRSELEPLIGLFLNTQALRIDLSADPSVAALLAQVRAIALAAQDHQDLPFEQVIEALNPSRSMAHAPLYQVVLAMQNTPQEDLTLPGLHITTLPTGQVSAQVDLWWSISETDAGLHGSVIYASTLFERATVQRWMQMWITVLRAMTAQPACAVSALPLLPEDQRTQLLQQFNHSAAPWPDAPLLQPLFAAQCRRTPDAPALSDAQLQLSYAQLDARANRLAHRLIAAGVRPDTRVALYLSRGAERLVALLAVFKAGGAYVPLDPDQPTERVAFMLDDARVRVVLTDTQLQQQLPASRALQQTRVLLLDVPTSAADTAHDHAPVIDGLHPDHLAYVVYTSGSTGQPKGVMVSHRGLVNLAVAQIAAFGVQPHSRVLQLASIGFDACVSELLMAWLAGACLHVPRAEALAGSALLEVLQQQRITHLTVTPTVLASLPEQVSCPSLQTLVLAGEAADTDLARRWQAHTRVINAYGPTEASVCASLHLDGVQHGERLPIGRPMANVRLYVLDPHGRPAPIGVAGELHIAGHGLARGYLRRPDLTAERFVPDPFAQQPGQRMYKTGDLARWTADGNLEFLGRNDDQIKLRGVRIELAEIESALRSCAGVRDAVVIAAEDSGGGKRLVAYLVGNGLALDAGNLRTELASRLPEVMLPAAYVQLDALPLTPNGKLDRRALPAPDTDALATHTYVAPEGELEGLLAALWSELLGVEQVSRHASFFALGGHSLLAIKLIERLRQHGWALQVRALFGATTLADLAAALRPSGAVEVPPNRITVDCTRITPALLPLVQLTQDEIDAAVATVDGGAANVQDIYPLTALQEGLLFHHRASSLSDAYLSFSVLAFDTRAQLDAFIAALEAVIARHDILRTGFAWQGLSAPVQIVWRHATLPRQEHCIDASDVLAALKQRMDPRSARMDITQAPLLRGHLVEDRHHARWLLGLQTHHLMIDHTTLELLIEEVQAHLDQRQQQLPEPLPFRNLVAQARLGVSEAEHRAFFTQQLGDLETPTAPFDLWEVRGSGAEIEEHQQLLPQPLCAALRLQARRLDVSPASVFHLAYALMLAQASGRDDVVFGTTLFGRMHAGSGAHRVLGMFINTLPIRLRRDHRGVHDAVRDTQQRLAQLIHHEHAPLALAQRCSGIVAPAPLFIALLNYRHAGGSAVQAPSGTSQAWHGIQMLESQDRTSYPLTLSVDDIRANASFALQVQVDQRIGAARVIALMLQAVQALVKALEDAPETALHALHLLPADERAQLQDFTVTETTPLAHAQCIHHLFEAQVRRTPNAIALYADNRELSYAALDARANRLAHRLCALGVTPEHRVALYLPRGIEQIVALLATLKAGAAYLPLDPELPDARLAFLLDDSRPRAVLTCDALHARLQSLGRAMQGASVLTLDQDADVDLHDPGAPTIPGLCPDNLAYVIYTSGSTGQPKGTLLTHAGATHYLQWASETYRPFPSAVVSSSLAFDATLTSLLAPLLCGARVELLPEHNTLGALRQRLCDPTPLGLVKLTPAHLEVLGQQFADHAEPLSPAVMVIGGEALSPATLARWQALAPNTRLINEYGPTETVVGCVVHDATHDAPAPNGRVPIGRPIDHLRIHVLDRHGQLTPIGVAGHLHIAGPQLARGYLGRPDLTAERFVPDPFAAQPGQRMYRSGDLASWHADGTLDVLGRNDDQVKLRGFRIELGEIVAALRACAGVRDAAVLLREDTPGEQRLVAYLVDDAGNQSAPLALREALAARLPEVMLPSAYVRLDALPLTANGKLDRRALPAPGADALAAQAYLAPEGEQEILLATLWSELLEIERIGRNDSFFALGGDSLLAIVLIERLQQSGWQLDIGALFNTPVLGTLADALRPAAIAPVPANRIVRDCTRITPDLLPLVALTQTEIDAVVATVAGGAANVQDIYPLASLQEGLLFHHLQHTDSDPYVMPGLHAFASRAELDRFLAALNSVIARHDILRTAFVWHGVREAVQVVWRQAPLRLHSHVLESDDALEQLQRCLTSPQARIDPQQAPLLHAHLIHDAVNQRWLLGMLYHHLVMDHTSMDLAIEEVGAFLAGTADALPAPLPFREFVARARLRGAAQTQEAFFSKLLGDVTQTTAPYGMLDVHGDGSTVREAHLQVPDALTQALRAHARALNVSMASLFHLAYALVVATTSGRDDVVFGTTLFGRMQGGSGIHRVLGMFLNTLPLRLRIDTTSVADAVSTVQGLLAMLMQHEHAPLSLAQRCSGVAAPAPLFTALLNYRHVASSQASDTLPDWAGMQSLGASERTNYPLSLSVNDDDRGFWLDVQTGPAATPESVGQLMLEALRQVSQALADAPHTALHDLHILPELMRTDIVVGFNPAPSDAPAVGIAHLFAAQAARTPQAPALIDAHGSTLTYAELAQRAERLACRLRALGIGPEARVAVCMPRGIDLVATLLGVFQAGAAYVPLDPEYPAQRRTDILRDCQPQILVATSACAYALPPQVDVPLLWYDAPGDAVIAVPTEIAAPHAAQLAYLIYTSGSSGRPKGVMVEHGALAAYCVAAAELFGLSGEDDVLQQNSINFDLSLEELLPALIAGACLRLAPLPLDAVATPTPASVLHLTSAHWHALVSVWTQAPEQARQQLQQVRLINITGDVLSPYQLQQWYGLGLQAITLINTYGPTETAISCTAARLCTEDANATRISIGTALRHARLYVLDARLRTLPIGVAGELYVAGAQVGRGYHARPALSAQCFLPDPFALGAGQRMYRTGDLARWNADGSLEFLGRNDQQLKLRGFRVELGEIENVLLDYPGVREAAVCARQDATATTRLLAYVVADAIEPDRLHTCLAQRLPDYMLPSAYVRLDALPLTPNRKLDRNALPVPDAGTQLDTQAHVPPHGPFEQTLAMVWAELLDCDRVGRQDSFFALGGHSLLAVRLASRLRSHFGVDVGLADIFAHPRLADFAGCVAAAAANTLPPILPVPRDRPLPLSFAQQRLWFLSQLDPHTDLAYLVSTGVHLDGALDLPALRKALDRIVARHETLRTRIVASAGQPQQEVLPADTGFALRHSDLSALDDPASRVRQLCADERQTTFAPGTALVRGHLLRLAPQRHVLLITLHHLVCDGWSMGVLIEELGTLYSAYARQEHDPLPPLALQYADVAVWQRRWLEGDVLQRQLDYWRERLHDAPRLLALPTDHTRPARQDFHGDTIAFSLPAAVSAGLHTLSLHHGVTPFMTLLAAWALLLHRYSGQDEVVIGSPLAGRDRSELEPLIGFFVNTVALRIDLSGRPTVAQLLERVCCAVLGAQAHQDLPFDRVIEAVQPSRTLAHAPLCQVLFSSDTTPSGELEMPGLQLQPLQGGTAVALADLALEMRVGRDSIAGSLIYATALFERATLQRHLAYYQALLCALADASEAQVADDLPLPAPAQQHLPHVPACETLQSMPTSVHAAFAHQLQRTPTAPAVCDGTLQLTYADLEMRSDALAQQLRAAGVGVGMTVATALPRSAALVIAQLAILKLGAAYLPLDPQQPALRLAQLVEDCHAVALLYPPQTDPVWAGALHCLPVDVDALTATATRFAAATVPGNAPAYVMYTSGSTGVPKGVAIPHCGILNLVLAPDYADWNAQDRFAFASNPAFDSTTLEVWAPLLCGACVVVVPQAVVLDPGALAGFIGTHAISVLILVAGVLRAYAPQLAVSLPTLRYLITGGDVADPHALALLLGSANAPEQVLQTYGPTEATQFATTLALRQPPPPDRRIPIGQPIRHMQAHLVDARGTPVPIGIPGQLHLAGVGLAQGYVGRPGATAERFVPDPFAMEPGARMYRTGDLARWREDGSLDFLGRADAQVKLRGFRIEPGEIEAVLASHPQVAQAVVHVQFDSAHQPRLLAYIVAEDPDEDAALCRRLRAWLAERLPDYMQPTAYIPLQRLPLTANGKLDRDALPSASGQAGNDTATQAPQGACEQALARLWCDLLGVERVGRHDDFFEVGGHSLLAVQLIARIESQLQRRIAVSQLFAHSNLAALAALLEATEVHSDDMITASDREDYLA
ncbi:non-ribosomal peptide synthetase [Xanthomonas prunicola]|uniref:Non-ribosomal peptide synthetase n=1 Tax=Xanthomonas prunicola TaxID=2053930 RepID=A0A2N3RGM3_9XANT|nr:non-ribosomal peptide synthetase [Xanthomonas prunicola]PKV11645.1 non-ribosomal peptide synthetase [Xanthomonas prunicola]